MPPSFLNQTYFYFFSLNWGYSVCLLPLLVYRWAAPEGRKRESLNVLCALNLCPLPSAIFVFTLLLIRWYRVIFQHLEVHYRSWGMGLAADLSILARMALALAFLSARNRLRTDLSLLGLFLLNWDKLYLWISLGSYSEASQAWNMGPDMPGREFSLLFFLAFFFCVYAALAFAGRLPYASSLIPHKKRRGDVL